MRFLQLQSQEVFSDEQKEILEFAPVYGVVKYPIEGSKCFQEWLIMKRYDNAERVKTYKLQGPQWHRHGMPYLGFDIHEHPRLQQAIDSAFGDWNDLVSRLESRGLPVSDLSGRNILHYPGKSGQTNYAIIDQKVY